MIPLRDDNPTRRTPWVTLLLIAVNIAVFVLVQPSAGDPTSAAFTYERAAIPCEVTTGQPLDINEIRAPSFGLDLCGHDPTLPPVFPGKQVFLAVIVSMFLHGSVLHLAGNMLFLWVFGNNIEDRMGRLRYLVFYLVAGVVATLTHVATQPHSTTPVIGASGAIAGVMGAYLVWFPNVEVLSLVFIVFARIRAKWWLLVWFVMQFFVDANGGVAWAAHVGGFVFGAVVALALWRQRPRSALRVRVPG